MPSALLRRAACVVVAGLCAGPWPAAYEQADAVYEFAFEFQTKQPIVPVRLNGGPPVPFVVDTGASVHLIDRPAAQAARAVEGTASRLTGGGSATVDVRWVDGLTLATGTASWGGQRAAVVDLGYPDRRHFAGLLGAPILMRYTVQFGSAEQRCACSSRRLLVPAGHCLRSTAEDFRCARKMIAVRAIPGADGCRFQPTSF